MLKNCEHSILKRLNLSFNYCLWHRKLGHAAQLLGCRGPIASGPEKASEKNEDACIYGKVLELFSSHKNCSLRQATLVMKLQEAQSRQGIKTGPFSSIAYSGIIDTKMCVHIFS